MNLKNFVLSWLKTHFITFQKSLNIVTQFY